MLIAGPEAAFRTFSMKQESTFWHTETHTLLKLCMSAACFAGPEGTPYSGGCFHFDFFFPPDYPNIPPLMVLETTGLGRGRFHPNLYADVSPKP